MSPQIPDLAGRTVARRYKLESVVGEGGFGRVYRARDSRLDVTVAVKVIHPWFAQDPEWVTRFEAEARMTAKISHPGVVRVTDAATDAKVGPYVVCELVDGESLRSILSREGKLPLARAWSIAVQAADALAAAHGQNIVHRDVKPSNLLIGADDRVRICDFGIARLRSGLTETSASLTMIGTPSYMAPEQARGRRTGPAADQYALAIVVCEMLTGAPPFTGESVIEVAMAHQQDVPPPLPSSVPANVRAAVSQALSKDPDDRFPSVSDFAAAITDPATIRLREPVTEPAGGRRRPRTPRSPAEARTTVVEATEADADPSRLGGRGAVALVAAALAVVGLVLTVLLPSGKDPSAPAPAAAQANGGAHQTATTADAPATPDPVPVPHAVPIVKGLSENGARARLRRRGFRVDVVRRRSRTTADGAVARQHPAAGTRMADGATVRLTISTGPPPVAVPSVVGSSVAVAESDLTAAGLQPEVTQVASARSAGTVLSSEPAASDRVPAGSTVHLDVARAKSWRIVGSFTLDSDGSTPSFGIAGRQWRITYEAKMTSCSYTLIACSPPLMEIDPVGDAGTYQQVDLSSGTHSTAGPDGPGRFKLDVSSYSGEWTVKITVEQLS